MRLLSLPNEVLDAICDRLAIDGRYEALTALRLTCRGLVEIPERYLFQTIYLDARIDSLEMLEALSQHRRLRGMVQEIELDAEPMYPTITRDQWTAALNHCSTAAKKDGDDLHDLHHYYRELTSARDSMDDTALTNAWNCYEKSANDQHALMNMHLGTLQRRLGLAFSRFDNLGQLVCAANVMSKYRLANVPENHPRVIRRGLLEALAAPGCVHAYLSHDECDGLTLDSSQYAAAAVYAMLCYAPAPSKIKLSALWWEVTEKLVTLFSRIGMPPQLDKLQHLSVDLVSDTSAMEGRRSADAVLGLSWILKLLPNLKTFSLVLDGALPSFYHERPYLILPRNMGIHLTDLQVLDLWGLKSWTFDFEGLLTCVARTLKRFAIGNVRLRGGWWVDVFSLMHKLRMTKVSLQVSGPLIEEDWNLGHKVWDFEQGHRGHQPEDCLWSQVKAWIAGKTDNPPLQPSDEGGDQSEWDRVSHEAATCMTYARYEPI